MSITVSDCLKLPALREAEVVAGAAGLSNIVAHVSVLEWSESSALTNGIFLGNEIVLTSFYYAKNDIEAQCAAIKDLKEAGEVGMILYYIGVVLPDLDERLIRTADLLGFPLICMPKNRFDNRYRYSEVISEIMEAIFKDQMKEKYYVKDMLERISMLPDRQRTFGNVLRMLSDRLRCSIILADREFKLLDAATWPMPSDLNLQDVLDQYKNKILSMTKIQPVDLVYHDESIALKCQPVTNESGISLNLVFLNLPDSVSVEYIQQAAELVQLSGNIWHFDMKHEGHMEMIKALLYDEPIKKQRIANLLHIDTSQIQVMWVIKCKTDASDIESLKHKNNILFIQIHEFFKEHHINTVVDIFENSIVALIEVPSYSNAAMTEFAEALMEIVNNESMVLFIVNSVKENAVAELRKAYFEIQDSWESALKIYPQKNIINIHEIHFAGLCKSIVENGKDSIDDHLRILNLICDKDDPQGRELISTLETFLLDAQSNVEQTGKMMFLHKSTIKYRIRKIKELLSCDILKLPEAYELYVAIAIKRLISNM